MWNKAKPQVYILGLMRSWNWIPSFSEILHFVEVATVVITAFYAIRQLSVTQKQNSADFAIRLSQTLDTGTNKKIMDELDSDPTTPILKRSKGGGRFTLTQIEWYLDTYEMLDDFYQNGLITCRMMYNEFSYDIEKAYKNKDVMTVVAEDRKDDPTSWQGFLDIGKQFDNNYHCQ